MIQLSTIQNINVENPNSPLMYYRLLGIFERSQSPLMAVFIFYIMDPFSRDLLNENSENQSNSRRQGNTVRIGLEKVDI